MKMWWFENLTLEHTLELLRARGCSFSSRRRVNYNHNTLAVSGTRWRGNRAKNIYVHAGDAGVQVMF